MPQITRKQKNRILLGQSLAEKTRKLKKCSTWIESSIYETGAVWVSQEDIVAAPNESCPHLT